jgi:molybdopterin-guanine dinucleotide biosynthesis protein A
VISNDNKEASNTQAPLYGLVLAGGRSKRMGFDKGAIKWHGKEQRYYMADLLSGICGEVFISCRPEQQNNIDSKYKTLPDTYSGLGPYGAILSAFKENPDVAWLVIACDLPLMDEATLQYLVQHRDTSLIATTFKSPFDGLPEPLITIWEPASLPILLSFLSEGLSCPRKTLIKSGDKVNILIPPDEDALMNANTPEDAGKVKQLLIQRN